MRLVQFAALAAVVSLVGSAEAATAAVVDSPPTGYVQSYGASADISALPRGTHVLTFWSAATPQEEDGFDVWLGTRMHHDAANGSGRLIRNEIFLGTIDLDRLRQGTGQVEGANFWFTIPDDYDVTGVSPIPDNDGLPQLGITHYTFRGYVMGLQHFEDGVGLPYWFTIDSPDALTAVPEPATWAMMITGFGMMGSVFRRRRALA